MRNTRADVVAAALRVLGEQGLEGCSMRRVAAELDVQPSALYHHVPNKQSLLALMADEIVGAVGASAGVRGASARAEVAADGSTRGVDSRLLCIQLRYAMLSTRDGADVVATASAFRLGSSEIERRLAQLAGIDGARTLLLYTFGHAQSTQTHLQALAFGALIAEEARPAKHAEGAELGDPPPQIDPAAELNVSFERGLDIILAGLAFDRN